MVIFRVVGSVAAAWMASIGNVVAGSLFATLQSMTMTGTLMAIGGGLIAVGVAGLAGAAEWGKGVEWATSVDWTKGGNWAQWVKEAGLEENMARQWKQITDGAQSAMKETEVGIKEGWKKTKEGVNSVDWDGIGKKTEEGLKEGWKNTEEGVKEGWQKTEEGVKSIDWDGMGKDMERVFTGGG